MSQVCVLGIDPGKQGAIALLCNDPQTVDFWLMRDIDEKRTSFEAIVRCDKKDYEIKHIYVEKCQTFPGQGAVSTFNYGMSWGKLVCQIENTGIPYTMVAPVTWTKAMHAGCSGKTAKEKSAMAVQRLFPGEDLRSITGNVKLIEGLVDALLIAEYGRRIFR